MVQELCKFCIRTSCYFILFYFVLFYFILFYSILLQMGESLYQTPVPAERTGLTTSIRGGRYMTKLSKSGKAPRHRSLYFKHPKNIKIRG